MSQHKTSALSSRFIKPILIAAVLGAGFGGYYLVRYHDQVTADALVRFAAPQRPPSLSGSYLAARFASQSNDLMAAAHYSRQALQRDGDNPAVLFDSLRRFVASGSMEMAVEVAKKMQRHGSIDPLASMVLLSAAAKEGEYAKARAAMGDGVDGGLYALVEPLFAEWLQADTKPNTDMDAKMDKLIREAGFLLPFIEYHRALLYDYRGQDKEALAAFLRAKGPAESTPYRVTQVFANYYLRHGKKEKAEDLFSQYQEHHPDSGLIPTEIPDYSTPAEAIRPIVATPVDGVAEIFFTTASLLFAEQAHDEALIYLRLALFLRPDLPPAQLMLAHVLEQMKDYRAAISVYQAIDKDTVFFRRGQVRSAVNYELLGESDTAISILERYGLQNKDDAEAYATLGDVYRSKKQFDRAVQAYGAAIKRSAPWNENDWNLFYARAMSYERAGHWQKAEADFKQALALKPKQPDVLNYLGYSWLVQDMHISKAKRYIEQAVEERPYDAHIVDSMGWAYFMTGDFRQAVEYLEQAVDLAPQDPTINDHLGDAYWRVGRKAEAEFQWERALTFKPEKDDADTIKRKLEYGLPPAVVTPSPARDAEATLPQAADEPDRPAFRAE